MIWFWSRASEKMQLETRFDNDSNEYVLTIRFADGREAFERFPEMTLFRQRLVTLENQLEADKWVQSGTPIFDPAGFPNKRSPSGMN